MDTQTELQDITIGERAIVDALHITGGMRRRLLDIGLVEGTLVECVGKAPSGNPIAFCIRGAVFALRREDCRNIHVRRL